MKDKKVETRRPLEKQGLFRKSLRVGTIFKKNNKMKNVLILAAILLSFGAIKAQTQLDFTNKTFLKENKTLNSTEELFFTSKNQVTYIITSVINGNTYIDKCPGKATLSGNKISILCNCTDKEIYPDPIKDSFVYDSKNKTLTSTSYRSLNGVYFVWSLK